MRLFFQTCHSKGESGTHSHPFHQITSDLRPMSSLRLVAKYSTFWLLKKLQTNSLWDRRQNMRLCITRQRAWKTTMPTWRLGLKPYSWWNPIDRILDVINDIAIHIKCILVQFSSTYTINTKIKVLRNILQCDDLTELLITIVWYGLLIIMVWDPLRDSASSSSFPPLAGGWLLTRLFNRLNIK